MIVDCPAPRLRRRTLAAPATVCGVGIHGGAHAVVTLVPVPRPGTGVIFRVAGGAQEIPADASNVSSATRCTVLGERGGTRGGATISTVEHLLGALAGLGVSDIVAEVDGPELPIGDGSALCWTTAIERAGVVALGEEELPGRTLRAPLVLPGEGGSFIAAFPADQMRFTTAITFDHALVGTQVARFEPGRGDLFAQEIAPARTFGFVHEVEALRAAGLARGGSLENAVVVYPDRFSTPLRFPDELARHKLLDLIGDLSLAGPWDWVADVVAVRPSHRLNIVFAGLLKDALR